MTERAVIRCINPQQAHQALIGQVWPLLKAHLIAGRRMVV